MPRKGINSKQKGASFELSIAKTISAWWGEEFHRTPASGGLHWQKDNRVAGDIVPPEGSNFPFCIECKKREGWNFEQVLKDTGEVSEWWTQCLGDAERVNKIPLLIFSKNRSPVYYMLPFGVHQRVFKGAPSYRTFTTVVCDLLVVIGFFDDLLKINKEWVERVK